MMSGISPRRRSATERVTLTSEHGFISVDWTSTLAGSTSAQSLGVSHFPYMPTELRLIGTRSTIHERSPSQKPCLIGGYGIWKAHGWADGRKFPAPDPMHVQFATGA